MRVSISGPLTKIVSVWLPLAPGPGHAMVGRRPMRKELLGA
jgi:hypothetical protein